MWSSHYITRRTQLSASQQQQHHKLRLAATCESGKFRWKPEQSGAVGQRAGPTVSIVVPFLGMPYRILIIYLVTPKMELQWRL